MSPFLTYTLPSAIVGLSQYIEIALKKRKRILQILVKIFLCAEEITTSWHYSGIALVGTPPSSSTFERVLRALPPQRHVKWNRVQVPVNL